MKDYNVSEEPYFEYFMNNGYKFLDSGYMHCIFEKNDKVYKIAKSKFNDFDHLSNYLVEQKSMKVLRDNNIQVPIIYGISEISIEGYTYFVMEEQKINGIVKKYNDMNDREKNAMYELITKVSRIKLSYYGPLMIKNNGKYTSWNEYLNFLFDIATMITHKYKLNLNIEKVINDLKNKNLVVNKASFLILDPNEKNILFNCNSEIIGLIDVDHPLGGDPLYQLAGYKYFLEEYYEFLLNKGYINKRQEEIISLYCIIFSLNDLYFRTNAESKINDINYYIDKILNTYNMFYKEEF